MTLPEAMKLRRLAADGGVTRRTCVTTGAAAALAWATAGWGATGTTGAANTARARGAKGGQIRALVESWPPYLLPGTDRAMRGLDADLLQAICKQAGYELVWIRGPVQWRKRRFRELQNDQFDVIFSATPTPQHQATVMYSRPYREETFMVAAERGDARVQGVRNFEDVLRRRLSLLHVDALSLGDDFESWRPRLAEAGLLQPYQTSRQGVDMLRLGRAPLILGDELDLLAQARETGLRLERQPFGFSVLPVSLMLSRRRLDERDVARIDQAIHALEQRGTLAAIRQRYVAGA